MVYLYVCLDRGLLQQQINSIDLNLKLPRKSCEHLQERSRGVSRQKLKHTCSTMESFSLPSLPYKSPFSASTQAAAAASTAIRRTARIMPNVGASFLLWINVSTRKLPSHVQGDVEGFFFFFSGSCQGE
jgi:hypothetical protein